MGVVWMEVVVTFCHCEIWTEGVCLSVCLSEGVVVGVGEFVDRLSGPPLLSRNLFGIKLKKSTEIIFRQQLCTGLVVIGRNCAKCHLSTKISFGRDWSERKKICFGICWRKQRKDSDARRVEFSLGG